MKKIVKPLKIIEIPQKDFKEMKSLYREYGKIYGNENTVWDFEDVDGMREIGQEFMEIFFANIKKMLYRMDL